MVLHAYQVVNTKDVCSHSSTCLSVGKYKGRTFTRFCVSERLLVEHRLAEFTKGSERVASTLTLVGPGA